MAELELELDREAVRQLLRSSEMAGICRQQAEAIRARCGSGYEADSYTGKNRVNASVYAATGAAVRDNLKNNTLLKAVK